MADLFWHLAISLLSADPFQAIPNHRAMPSTSLSISILILPFILPSIFCQNAADLEFSPYVYKAVDIPFKSSNYAKDWFGSDVALVQHPLLAPAKPSKPGNPVALPTIAPLVVSWKNLDDTHINDENGWNFEKRVDSKVWWPN